MSNDRFFRTFLAALRLAGVEFIATGDDLHHKKFQAVARQLGELGDEQQASLPAFVPSPFTGRFRELEDALLQLQRGYLGARNPFYPGIHLDISTERAKAILEHYSPDEQALFLRLAGAFKASGTSDVAAGDKAQGCGP